MTARLRYEPDHVAPPGALIQELLEQHDISGRELARRCGRSAKLISEIILGKAPIEPETALQLERVFVDHPASLFMGIETQYRLHLAQKEEDKEFAKHLPWAEQFPLKELAKRGLIELKNNAALQVRELLRFFGCGSRAACDERFDELLAVAYRHSPTFESNKFALLAWLRVGDIRAETVKLGDYDRAKFIDVLKQIRTFTIEPIDTFLPKMVKLCEEVGVVFVLERSFTGMAVSGVSRWLSPRRAVIQLTARYLSNDHFWFTFFHECAHLLLHSRKQMFLEGIDPAAQDREAEDEANEWAANFLVPSADLTRFIMRSACEAPDVIEFAAEHGIAPGIVVGQLQHRKVITYSRLNGLKQRYRWVEQRDQDDGG